MKLTADQVQALEHIARGAGHAIMSVYDSDDFDVEAKGDGSPLTRADRLAHRYIVDELARLTPEIPVLSEESGQEVFDQRRQWRRFWLVDPLDGTKEFVKRNGEFTVNIALIDDTVPVFGVVYAPALDRCYIGGGEYGAWCTEPSDEVAHGQSSERTRRAIQVTDYKGGPATVVASRSHRSNAVEEFLNALTQQEGEPNVKSMGSSLKICLVAEGQADVYPRLGPTSEWDTAAAHAVVLGAGGAVTDHNGNTLVYNKENILNPWFLVAGAGGYGWPALVPSVARAS